MVTKKLAGSEAGTAAWVSNVGNEHGQVLMSVLTSHEGQGLLPMTSGLVKRYEAAGVAPPTLLYVGRDCCSAVGTSRAAAIFSGWSDLAVLLDVWHFMQRFTSGLHPSSHLLYGLFMANLSACIFIWDERDVILLREANMRELEQRQGITGLTAEQLTGRLTSFLLNFLLSGELIGVEYLCSQQSCEFRENFGQNPDLSDRIPEDLGDAED